MLYDLNVPWTPTTSPTELQRTISFLTSLGYHTLALTHTLSASAMPSQITNPIPLPTTLPANTTLLRRLTLTLSDPSHNHRLPALAAAYDILALRPTTEKAYLAACNSITEHSIISLDLTLRYPFHWKPKPAMTAVNRGVRFEICYAQGMGVGGNGSAEQRRNFISNVVGIVRATKGRGLVVSSGAGDVLGVRGPADVLNLLGVWGLGRERGVEGMGCNPRGVVVNEGLKRRSFRGVVDVVEGGERAVEQLNKGGVEAAASGSGTQSAGKKEKGKGKRVAEQEGVDGTPVSKRQAKRLKLEALKAEKQSSQLQKEGGSSKDALPLKETSTLKESDTPSTIKEKTNG